MSTSHRTLAWVAASYLALTVLLTWPFATGLATHVLSTGTDMDLAVWTIGWDVHSFTHQPWHIFDANIFYPWTNTLAYSENLIGSALLAAPVVWTTGNVVLGMNTAVLLSVAISAFGAFLLARQLGLSVGASFLAGLVAAFAPPRFFRMEQLPISSVQWIPFALAALHRYFDTGRARDLRLTLLWLSVQAVFSGHGASMLILALAMLVLWKLAWGAPLAAARRVRDVGWQGLVALIPAALIYVPYKVAQLHVGLKRELDDWGLAPSSFFASPTLVDTWIREHGPTWSWLQGMPDAWLFPGWLPVALALLALWVHMADAVPDPRGRWWRRLATSLEVLAACWFVFAVYVGVHGGVTLRVRHTVWFSSHGATPWIQLAAIIALRALIARRVPWSIAARMARARAWWPRWRASIDSRDHLWFYAAVLGMTYWLAVGPPIGIWRVMYWMPGLNFVRMPSRFTVLGMLALGLVIAAGWDRLCARAPRRRRAVCTALAAVALVGEFAAWPMVSQPFEVEAPAVDRWIATQPPMALFELPLNDSANVVNRERATTRSMLHSMSHWRPIFEGFSGIQPPGYVDAYATLVEFPDPRSLALAARLGLTHVIVHGDQLAPGEAARLAEKFARAGDRVQLVHEDGRDRVYAIR